MLDSFFYFLAQLEGEVGEQGPEAIQETAARSPSMMDFLLPIMMVLVVMMLFMRPRKGDQATRQNLADLKKHDRVVTAGGIIGTVMTIREESNQVTLRIDEASNAKMQILRSSIVKVLTEEKEGSKPSK